MIVILTVPSPIPRYLEAVLTIKPGPLSSPYEIVPFVPEFLIQGNHLGKGYMPTKWIADQGCRKSRNSKGYIFPLVEVFLS